MLSIFDDFNIVFIKKKRAWVINRHKMKVKDGFENWSK